MGVGARKAIAATTPRSQRMNRGLKNPVALMVTQPVEPPVWLNTEAGRQCFHDLQLPLIQAGILQTLDMPNLALMAQFWSDYIEARDIIRGEAESAARYVAMNGKSDLFNCMMESLKQYQALLSKFAGSPIDRTKIVIREQKKKSGVADIFGDGSA